MSNPQVLSDSDLRSLDNDRTVVWTTPRLLPQVHELLPQFAAAVDTPRVGIPNLIVVGGGTLIDTAKFWRRDKSPGTWLCAIPSLWGSGAEGSPIAVRTIDSVKIPDMGKSLLPNARAILPGLADSVSEELARWGMGDTWSHAIEAFLSPLASEENRRKTANFITNKLVPAETTRHPRWFELSAQACQLQSESGVGLIHALAHVLEPRLDGFGHARLCSAFLLPVFEFNCHRSTKVAMLCESYGIASEKIKSVIRSLGSLDDYNELLPSVAENWPEVNRHPLARINCALVRSDALSWFLAWSGK